ncbi:ribosomal large subunit pseudouridine synthase D [Listeria floridensis FSL S10-1187]|uniref:Pseudouridine synthase n=1 Tax=Listeria floridensis FSL S10-1187 TaxID=1265817 RepID=A0ABP3B127_9LIST|nr:RluA family pseudouridine synthase [Listeria floridensis]EUJ33618.1 ribosomal large subunit pseudouridine synthase D [Listeria floridensis FSL S10-1187]
MLTIEILPAWQHLTLTELFRDTFHLGKKRRHELKMSEELTLDGKSQPNWDEKLSAGMRLEVPFQDENIALAEKGPLDIVYEDAFILVLNKSAGVKTHPNKPNETGTLANSAAFYLKNDPNSSPYAVHRLDQETSGLVLFAKNPLSLAAFSWLLENRDIHRRYVALAGGRIKQPLTINKPIGTDRHHPNKQRVSEGGKSAITHVTPLKWHQNENTSLVELTLETGRTHQIRVHLSSIGHPIVGDRLYGGISRAKRTLLHAKELELFHPFFDKKMHFHVEPPKDFRLS